ncbi:hypothetical protein JJD41_17270 [Oxynema sp. CENA135]|uniref:hypothetical protein n=1 Tax=Oxynema sp. CENA135 TaxID=984206 RepID=UPI00190DB67D|nr:hypothetical protein [Oxynema sp. CENA135]MBK4731602.1 hypothetical protein [Oxynema sp. CENA135]
MNNHRGLWRSLVVLCLAIAGFLFPVSIFNPASANAYSPADLDLYASSDDEDDGEDFDDEDDGSDDEDDGEDFDDEDDGSDDEES